MKMAYGCIKYENILFANTEKVNKIAHNCSQMKFTYLLLLLLALLTRSVLGQKCGSIHSCQGQNSGPPCYGYYSAGVCHQHFIGAPESYKSGYVRDGNYMCTGFSEPGCRGKTFLIKRNGVNYPFVMRSFRCPPASC